MCICHPNALTTRISRDRKQRLRLYRLRCLRKAKQNKREWGYFELMKCLACVVIEVGCPPSTKGGAHDKTAQHLKKNATAKYARTTHCSNALAAVSNPFQPTTDGDGVTISTFSQLCQDRCTLVCTTLVHGYVLPPLAVLLY